MSRPYIIYTDVTSDLPKDIIVSKGIHHIALPYAYGNEELYYDLVKSNDADKFYEALRNGADYETFVPDTDYYAEKLGKYISQGMDVLFITMSSALSDTYKRLLETKELLKAKYPDNDLIVIDSKRLSGALGLIVLKAIEMQQMGASLGEVYQWVERYKPAFRALFMVDNVFHLKRRSEAGQAISASGAHLANILQVKPIMHVDGLGRPAAYDKSIGKSNAINQFAKIIAEKAYEPEKNIVFICHADCLDNAKKLQAKIADKANFKEIIITTISPVIGAHIGAGALGIAYLGEE